MAAQEREAPGGSGDGADSGRRSPRVYPPSSSLLILFGTATYPPKIHPRLPHSSVWSHSLTLANELQEVSWVDTSRKLTDFLTKRTNQWAWSFPLYPSPFLPAWVTVVTPRGSITLLPKRLKAAAQGVGQEVSRSLGP